MQEWIDYIQPEGPEPWHRNVTAIERQFLIDSRGDWSAGLRQLELMRKS
jgi:hypothetical protein